MLYWSHKSLRRPNLSVCPAPGVPGGGGIHKHMQIASFQQQEKVSSTANLLWNQYYFQVPIMEQMFEKCTVWSVIFLHLRWQSKAKEASQLLCPLWLVCPTVRCPDRDKQIMSQNPFFWTVWKCLLKVFSLQILLPFGVGTQRWYCMGLCTDWREAGRANETETDIKIIFSFKYNSICKPM